MSDGLGFNKIAGALLATGLAILMLREGADMVFAREGPPERAGYHIDAPEEGPVSGPAGPPDWGTVLPTADIAAGQQSAQGKCSSCHHFDASNQTGPGLFQVVGRHPGTHAGFSYSAPMVAYGAANPVWDYDHLFNFLGGPQRVVPGSRMTFAGIRDVQERVNVIAYLRSLGSTNVPIPPPRPAEAAAAPAEGAATNAAEAGATNAATAPTAAAGQTGAPSGGGGTAPATSTAPTTSPAGTPAPAAQGSAPGH
jgi:cytochrome c